MIVGLHKPNNIIKLLHVVTVHFAVYSTEMFEIAGVQPVYCTQSVYDIIDSW